MIEKDYLLLQSKKYLNVLCNKITERPVASPGNREASRFFTKKLNEFGWETKVSEFEAIDWKEQGAVLSVDSMRFAVQVSPYSLGCKVSGELMSVDNVEALEQIDLKGKIVVLHGKIAAEQLMPKSFVFYNPPEHQKIVSLLENCGAAAFVTVTGKNAALAGGVYPFPLIEDGDFHVPSVYMTEEEGNKVLQFERKTAALVSKSERIPGKAYNVVGKKGKGGAGRIIITAHIDAKKGSPGAIDNATGVIVLLLLAESLSGYNGEYTIELVAFNGEDYFSVPGQMQYIADNNGTFDDVLLNINIDGAGYMKGPSSFSFFNLPSHIQTAAQKTLQNNKNAVEGIEWVQGDHSIFLQYNVPAIAVSSKWFIENIDDQDITHTPKDNPAIVDCNRLTDITAVIEEIINDITKDD